MTLLQTQLVELQRAAPALAARDVALFAISYDPVETVRAFASEHGIGYPLLSDGGSHLMRRLGLVSLRSPSPFPWCYSRWR